MYWSGLVTTIAMVLIMAVVPAERRVIPRRWAPYFGGILGEALARLGGVSLFSRRRDRR